MLRMQAVGKSYQHHSGSVKALERATLHIHRGDYLSIVGPSGSGKSTLLLMLGGMLSPSQGRVLINGQSMYDLPPNDRARIRREHIGFVFQTFNLVPYLSARENVQIPLYLAGAGKDEQRERAILLLERLGLKERLQHKPAELSVGQQQRVALARVLANDPAIILADEPTGNLDPETSDQIIAFLDELSLEGRTIVVVTHDPRAAGHAGRTVRIEAGTVIEADRPPPRDDKCSALPTIPHASVGPEESSP